MIGNIKKSKLFLKTNQAFTPLLASQSHKSMAEGNKFLKGIDKSQGSKPLANGFTLLELLVAVAIFSSIAFITANIYLLSLKAQRHSVFNQRVLSQSRYLIELISRQIRSSQIDYNYYGGKITSFPENSLALINQDSESVIYWLNSETGEIFIQTKEGQAKLTSAQEFEVVYLDFYIIPQTDPFLNKQCQDNSQCPSEQCQLGWCLTPALQPMVTINLALRIKAPKIEEQKVVYFQTTVSNRVYKK